MMTESRTETYWTPEELAERLKLSKMTIYKLLKNGELPSFRVGRTYRIPESVFHRYTLQAGNLSTFLPQPKVPSSATYFVHLIETASPNITTNIVAVVLFGSYARGDIHEDSDIDMLVLVHDNTYEVQTQLASLSTDAMASSGYDELLSPIKMSLDHWKKLGSMKTPLYEEIQKDGIILWPKNLKSLKAIENERERN
ncbi:MAG: excisionase family DNA-binding protein [Deltaproteobacteria bacterium]|nr:excisionase family DNA-binding protein [Deltaproteobacteria bacterium]